MQTKKKRPSFGNPSKQLCFVLPFRKLFSFLFHSKDVSWAAEFTHQINQEPIEFLGNLSVDGRQHQSRLSRGKVRYNVLDLSGSDWSPVAAGLNQNGNLHFGSVQGWERPQHRSDCWLPKCGLLDEVRSFILSTIPNWEPRYCSRYWDWLRAGRQRNRSSSPCRVKNFHSPYCPDWLWFPPNLLSNGYRGALFPGEKLQGREPPTSDEVKETRIYTSTHPYAFMGYYLIGWTQGLVL
jgi:hypothetical protein